MIIFDPTDKARGPGRPPKKEIEEIQATYWYWAVCFASKLECPRAIELAVSPETFKKRADGGWSYPGSFAKYLNGVRLPEGRTVAKTESKFEGTSEAIGHPFWKIADPAIEIEELYTQLAKLHPSITNLLFETRPRNSKMLVRRHSHILDTLDFLNEKGDLDALAACLGLIHEDKYSGEDSKYPIIERVALQIFLRIATRDALRMVAYKLFTYLKKYFLKNPNNQEWMQYLETLPLIDSLTLNSFTLYLIDDLNILKSYAYAPPSCLCVAQHKITQSQILPLFHKIHSDKKDSVKNLPEIIELTKSLGSWERRNTQASTESYRP